jgi:preprotein translocase subunit SecD
MSFCRRRFNLYLLTAALGLLVSGCAMWQRQHAFGAVLRVHIEGEAGGGSGSTKTITIMRSEPMTLTITTDPILTESDVSGARLVETKDGGFSVEITLEQTAGWKLEEYTADNPGKHLAIFAQWSAKKEDGRWLAAPYITRRLAGGTLTFTPDASHDEAQQLITALGVDAKRNAGVPDKDSIPAK